MFVLNLYCLHSYLALLEMYSHTSMGASQLCFPWFHFAFVGARNDPHHPSLQASCTGRGVQYVAGVGPSQVGRVRWTGCSLIFVHVDHFHVKKRRLHMGLSGGPYVWMEKRRSSWRHFPPENLPGSLIRTSPQRSKQCLRACRAKSRQSWSTRCRTFLSFNDGKIDVAHHDQVSVMRNWSFWKISSMALSQVGIISKHPRCDWDFQFISIQLISGA